MGLYSIWSARADVLSKSLLPCSLTDWLAMHFMGPVKTEGGVHMEVGKRRRVKQPERGTVKEEKEKEKVAKKK